MMTSAGKVKTRAEKCFGEAAGRRSLGPPRPPDPTGGGFPQIQTAGDLDPNSGSFFLSPCATVSRWRPSVGYLRLGDEQYTSGFGIEGLLSKI